MSNEQDKATARPWVVEHDGESDERTYFPVITFGARNIAVVEAYYGDGAANAALIVRAVNAHDKLVEACELAVRFVEDMCKGQQWPHENCEAWKVARAALALARGVKP